MILMKENNSKFLNFIFQEADGDENVPKNRKIVTVKRKGGRRVDYTQGADLEPPEEETPDTSAEEPEAETDTADNGPTMDDTDYTDAGNDAPEDTGTDSEPAEGDASPNDNSDGEVSDDMNIDEPTMDDTDYSDDSDSGDNSSEDMGSDEPTMDDTDYTDDSDGGDDATDSSSDDSSSDDSGDSGSQASPDEQARKYSLYRKFMKLNNLLESNTEVLSNAMFDDSEVNQKIKSVTSKLKETNRLLSEYMVVRFQTASYIQSMLFYQRVLAIININFNILQDLKKQINKNNNT